jgi:hypothetical protein
MLRVRFIPPAGTFRDRSSCATDALQSQHSIRQVANIQAYPGCQHSARCERANEHQRDELIPVSEQDIVD